MCSADTICSASDSLTYKIDTSYAYYFDNWYIQMGLYCKTPLEIGYIVSVYYIGYLVGTSFWFVPDKYGRKKTVIFSLSLELIAETVILWS